ncbi:hypothetical protein [Corynebacterium minutissimum]|uniref:Hypothetical membrane protein n=1 Tax=Corynebacterium minutissimum TaxID=38301 RepID=A0A2X4UQ18_9CORY|nr:hypothetical protein [Corynebacterium minutissimum]KHO29592.1 membrane protein [Corynebacterium minutissimum]MCG7229570.1 hypothetical protein [Corynebacterium minutissimum]MCG7238639.1 hypothetical protein [Corynebacterium minutissimum]QPS58723.1 hypothetical protein I6G51_07130 [Corynebacterium minutissimum]QQA80487.1 hypothetical protein I6H49_05730 [Corynebacterium minutissimum]
MTESTSSDQLSPYDDHRRPLKRALRLGAMGLVVVTFASLAIWGGVRGTPGLLGVLVGAAIGGGFVLFTAASVLLTARTTPSTTMAVVLGGWLLKVVILIMVLLLIKDLEFYDTMALFVTVICALAVTLGTEVWGVVTSNVTYVS